MAIGQQLKTLRLQFGLSQKQVATKIHVSRQAISQWENDINTPDIDNLILLSQLYQFDLTKMLYHTKNLNQDQFSFLQSNNESLNNSIVQTKYDDGILLLILLSLTFLISPWGLLIIPLVIRHNRPTNTFYWFIYCISFIALITNCLAVVSIVSHFIH